MPSTITDRLNGTTTSVAVKAPVRVATTANITLSGTQTIDDIAVVAGDRVLVKDQTTAIDNGIWICGAGTWDRAPDFDGTFDVVGGTWVKVNEGTANADSYWTVDGNGAKTPGTDTITFTASSGNLTLQADLASTASGKGAGLVKYKPSDANADAGGATLFQIMEQVPSLKSWLPNFTISATPSVNLAALNAFIADMGTRGRAECKIPAGEIGIDGTVTLDQPSLSIYSAGGAAALLISSDLTSDMVALTADNVTIEGLGLYRPGATAGRNLLIDGADNYKINEFFSDGGYIGAEITNSGVGQATNWQIYNQKYSNLFLHGGNGVNGVQGFNLVNADLTNSSSSDGLGGALRMEGFVSAPRLVNIEALGGFRTLVMTALSVSEVASPSYAHIVNGYFDGADRDCLVEYTLLCEFISSHFSGGRTGGGYDGLTLGNNKRLKFTGGKSNNNGNHGVNHTNTNDGVEFINFDTDNNGYTSGSGRGMSFESGSTGFTAIGGASRNSVSLSGPGQQYGVVTDTGCEGVIMGRTFDGNTVAPVINSSTSNNMIYSSNPGAESYDRVSVGGGVPLSKSDTASKTWDPGSLANGAMTSTTVTLANVVSSDRLVASLDTINAAGWFISAVVSAVDTVTVSILNQTGGVVDLSSGTLTVTAFRSA